MLNFLLGLMSGVLLTSGVVYLYSTWLRSRWIEDKIEYGLPNGEPSVIELYDWGPDFTGDNDILGRWRWMVRTPESEADGGAAALPVMLGNANTREEAIEEATHWICEHVEDRGEIIVSDRWQQV